MTQEDIRQQIQVIRQASEEARKTPETARQFLIDAGIIKPEAASIADNDLPSIKVIRKNLKSKTASARR